MAVKPGNTFLDTSDNPHLWVVVAGPDPENKIILFSLTSVKGRDDCTTVCKRGEHPFITRDTVIAYKYPIHVEVTEFEASVANGDFLARDDCSPELLKKIADGILKSDSTPIGIANAYVTILRM